LVPLGCRCLVADAPLMRTPLNAHCDVTVT